MTNPPISRDTIRGILERLNNNRPSRRSPCFSITDDLIENIYDALNESELVNENETPPATI